MQLMYYIESDDLIGIFRKNGNDQDLYIQTGIQSFEVKSGEEDTGYAITQIQLYNVSEQKWIKKKQLDLKPK